MYNGQSQLKVTAVGETSLQIPVCTTAPTLPACIDATMQGQKVGSAVHYVGSTQLQQM